MYTYAHSLLFLFDEFYEGAKNYLLGGVGVVNRSKNKSTVVM
jgi:hypothetical protein